MHKVTLQSWLCLLFLLAGCGDQASHRVTTVLEGRLVLPDGQTPLAGAVIYGHEVPEEGGSARQLRQQLACALLEGVEAAYTCTDARGHFALEATFPVDEADISAAKGGYAAQFQVPIDPSAQVQEAGTLTMPRSPSLGAPRIAVVTGLWDHLETTLAKLGFGTIETRKDEVDYGFLRLGSETFDLFDGDDSLPETYPERAEVFERLGEYDLLLINCGADEHVIQDDVRQALQTFVAEGGRLFVTDQAFDFIEQTFPQMLDGYGYLGTAAQEPELYDAAQVGPEQAFVKVQLHDALAKQWLTHLTCEEDAPCLNSDGTLTLDHLERGWSVIKGAHEGAEVRTHISIPLSNQTTFVPSGSTRAEKLAGLPLTLSFDIGKGSVLYSSYHYEMEREAEVGLGLTSQERLLQFWMLELF